MTAQSGRLLLLKLQTNTGYETVAGIRTRSLDFNLTPVDITDSASAGRWQELLSGSGIRHLQVSGEGVFKDEAADAAVRSAFFDSSTDTWQMVVPDFGSLVGKFLVTELSYAGDYNGEISWRLKLDSASKISFTPA